MSSDLLWTMAAGATCGVACALLGCYLVLRRLSLLGDAISHAVLPGLALAFLLTGQISGWPVIVGAIVFGLLTAFLTEAVQRFAGVREDAGMGVVFTSLFALGVILITRAASHVDLDPGCVLYGLIEFVPLDRVPLFGWEVPRAMLTLGPALLATIGFVVLFWKELKIVSFDPALATAMGLRAGVVHYLLMAMVAGVTVASFEAVGSILVIAMLIVPGATAHLLTDRLRWMMLWSALVAVVAAVTGTLTATWWNTSVAGMMAVAAGAQFAVAVFVAPRHGVVARLMRQLGLATRIAAEDILSRLYRRLEGPTHGREPSAGLLGRLALWQLWRRGEVERVEGGGLRLTAAGRRRAESLVRAHRLWEAYLNRELNLPADHVHEPAAAMEHFLDEELQKKLLDELSDTAHDPHGRVIPPR